MRSCVHTFFRKTQTTGSEPRVPVSYDSHRVVKFVDRPVERRRVQQPVAATVPKHVGAGQCGEDCDQPVVEPHFLHQNEDDEVDGRL